MIGKTVRLKEVAEVIAGQSPSGDNYNKEGHGTPFYQGKKDYGEKYLNTPTVWTRKVTKLAHKNDIILSVRAPVGALNISTQKICIGRGLAAIRVKKAVLNDYLYYFLMATADKLDGTVGAIFNSINKKQIEDIILPLPSLAEQQRIVAKLDTTFSEIDELLKITRDASKNANILLIRHLTKIFSDGQKDWLTAEIGDLCESLFAGGDVQKNKLSKFKTDKFNVPIFTNGEKNKGLYGFTDKARVFKPSITVSARGTIGYSELRTEPFYPAVRLIVITPNTNIVETDYLKHAIKIISFLNTGSSIPQLTVPMVKKYKIKFPKSKDAQKKIVAMLDNSNSEITELINISKIRTEKYILLKKSILTQELNNKAA